MDRGHKESLHLDYIQNIYYCMKKKMETQCDYKAYEKKLLNWFLLSVLELKLMPIKTI